MSLIPYRRSGHIWRVIISHAVVLGLGFASGGCHDLSQPLPAGTQDPTYYNNAAGALGMRNVAVFAVGGELPDYIYTTGLLTDELVNPSAIYAMAGDRTANGTAILDPVDERLLPELPYGSSLSYRSDETYNRLQGIRTSLLQAMGQLGVYDSVSKDTATLAPSAARALRGELFALYGFTEIQLADLFCSGIPLSTVDFQKDFTYRAGSATNDVYRDAIANLDTAVVLSGDSVRLQYLARVGLGRAYLDLGEFAEAAAAVASVPTDYQYQQSGRLVYNMAVTTSNFYSGIPGIVADTEGKNGLPFLSDGDPRTMDTSIVVGIGAQRSPTRVAFPRIYADATNDQTAATPLTIASGIEARLIEAEAALQGSGAGVNVWLAKLNQLRESAIIPGQTALLPNQSDSLPDLSDPGTDSARIALTFQERAYWLYMTGHRQGDLRRQLRQYRQYWSNHTQVYPTGRYPGLGAGPYGTDVTAPIPPAEYINPLFHGCLSRAP